MQFFSVFWENFSLFLTMAIAEIRLEWIIIDGPLRSVTAGCNCIWNWHFLIFMSEVISDQNSKTEKQAVKSKHKDQRGYEWMAQYPMHTISYYSYPVFKSNRNWNCNIYCTKTLWLMTMSHQCAVSIQYAANCKFLMRTWIISLKF